MIKKVKNTVPWTYIISDLKAKEIAGTLYEKELQKPNQKEFRVEKGDKLYVKWKSYDSFFNNWIDKKEQNLLSMSKSEIFRSKCES